MVIRTRPSTLRGAVDGSKLPQDAVFLIGDIHGQWDALDRLLAAMAREDTGAAARTLVTLGDTVHKGPRSRKVLKEALSGGLAQRLNADTYVPLMGNHEILLARALMALEQGPEGKPWLAAWARSGGDTLLSSWTKDRPGPWRDRLMRWRDGFPTPELMGLATWQKAWIHEGLSAVHAGFTPGVDWQAMGAMEAYLEAQPRLRKHTTHWATVRAPFLDWVGGFKGSLVVHGHTPPKAFFGGKPRNEAAVARGLDRSFELGRLCLDGGAGFGIGVAGALVFQGTVRLFFAPC
jgi:serine/threonine protein phosphatase 1